MHLLKNKPLYRSYHDFLTETFGCRVYKVSIDAGFTCPNRDGTKGVGGCIFCDETGSSSQTHKDVVSIEQQVQQNIRIRKTRYKAKKFIAYFQSFTNTYASPSHLKHLYDQAVHAHPDIVGLAISTRSDCVDEEKIALIASYKKQLPYVSVEYGLQTMHDKTLKKLNRHETFQDFKTALSLTNQYELDHCVHVILGLPGETREDMLETANALYRLDVRGVKIHLLTAMKNTPLAKLYTRGKWEPLSFDTYIALVCDFIQRLPPNCVIHRLSGSGHPMDILAPSWIYKKKGAIIHAVNEELSKRKALLQPI